MIQRIQHLYIFLAALVMILSTQLTICAYVCSINSSIYNLKLKGLFDNQNLLIYVPEFIWLLSIIVVAFVLLSIAIIVLFKNRKLQSILTYIALIAIIFYEILAVYISRAITTFLPADCNYSSSFTFGILLPLLTIVLTIMVLRGIKKDDDLIKSVDRLR
jgi:Domain of unknown function (DUF4293)